MWKEKLKKISQYEWEIPKEKEMKVPARVFIYDVKKIEEDALKQVVNVAKLPGIIKASLAMPDMHVGYGFPIGGVAVFDLKKGIVSPGGVGFDINCGVRLILTNISVKDFLKKRQKVLHNFKRTIPSGVGRCGERISRQEILEVMKNGSEWALKKGFATKQDIQNTEEKGKIANANPKHVSQRAIARGIPQLGTLGAGNHFIDILKIEEIFDKKTAKKFNLNSENICIMIHCGSRGLGHQVASDYIKKIEQEYGTNKFPDRELVYAPINSKLGQEYISAMNCAVNFAFCNRQIIMHRLRQTIKHDFPNAKLKLFYDIAHNIAKFEEHKVNGKIQQVCIHRKGATRCFPDKPVLIPGSMSTPSYILAGTQKALEKTFGSTAHGAGRAHSRVWTKKNLTIEQVKQTLKKKDIILEGSFKGTIEESELAYKDSEEVVNTCHELELGKKVAKLKPLAVMIS